MSTFFIRLTRYFGVLTCLLLLVSCASTTVPQNHRGQSIHDFGFIAINPNEIVQVYLKKQSVPSQAGGELALTIYIEGDGANWVLQMVPPRNPTPRRSIVASLATQDQGPFIIYLARPCQFIDISQIKGCDPSMWADRRFSSPVIQLSNDAIDKVLRDLPAVQLNLVGHSGGGTLATLIASTRNDVRCLVTLASPLDISAWARSLSVAPLLLSKNPADPNAQLKNIRQTHFFGENDSNVTRESIGNYRNFSKKTDFIVIPGFDHTKAWADQWAILQKKSCLALD